MSNFIFKHIMRLGLFFSIALTALLTLSCNKSAGTDRHLRDSLEHLLPDVILKFQVDDDTTALKDALGIVDRLLSMNPGNYSYKTQKIQLLIYDGQYDLAKTMIKDENMAQRIYPKYIFPEYENLLMVHLEALKANCAQDSLLVDKKLNEMQQILQKWKYSDSFNLKYFCYNISSCSQDIIYKEAMFLRWLNVIYTRGGDEAVQQELQKIINDYGLTDQLDEFTSETYHYDTVLRPYIFM